MSKLLMFGKAAKDAGYQRRRRPCSFSAWRMAAAFFRHIHFVVLGIVLGVNGLRIRPRPKRVAVSNRCGDGHRFRIEADNSAPG